MLYFTYFMMALHMFVGLILIGVILLQRGRGGGLAGAFGGMGGQSAFGTKAGDVFTKITIYLATAWIVLGGVCVLLASQRHLTKVTDGSKVGMKKAAEEKGGLGEAKEIDDKKDSGEDVVPGVMPKDSSDVKPEAKSEEKADEKSEIKTDAKPEVKPETPAETEKKEDEKKESIEKPKDAPAEKPAEEAKPKDDSTAEKSPTEKKPD